MKIAGRVIDAKSETRISEAKVVLSIENREIAALETDQQGAFEFRSDEVPIGAVLTVAISTKGYRETSTDLRVDSSEIEHTLSMEPRRQIISYLPTWVWAVPVVVLALGVALAILQPWHTDRSPDTEPPVITQRTPDRGTERVPLNAHLQLVFSEAVYPGAGHILVESDRGTAFSFDVGLHRDRISISNREVTIDPGPLPESAIITIRLDEGVLVDEAGNGLAPEIAPWSFSTVGIAPEILARWPETGQENVPVDTVLEIVFSESVVPGDGPISLEGEGEWRVTFAIEDGEAPPELEFAADTLRIVPSSLGEGMSVSVRVARGAIQDVAGNPFPGFDGADAWWFRTRLPTEDDAPASGSSGTALLARVNGAGIAQEAVAREASRLTNQERALHEQMGQEYDDVLAGAGGALHALGVQASALEILTRSELYRQAASEYGIQLSEDEVNARFVQEYEKVLQDYGLTEELLVTYLGERQQTLTSFLDEIRATVESQLRNEALRHYVIGAIAPTDDQLKTYFKANIEEYVVEEGTRASHILVEDETTAQDVYRQLQAGADFAELASEYSTDTASKDRGGDLDWFGPSQMDHGFAEAAYALDLGEFSEPVRTQFGYHIILLTGRRTATAPAFEEIRSEIQADYLAEEGLDRFTAWFDGYHDAAEIEILDPILRAYMMQEDDLEGAIAAYDALIESGEVGDPYLEYYAGHACQSLASEMSSEESDLETIEEPTQEEQTAIESLQALIEEHEAKALEHYLNVLADNVLKVDEGLANRILSLNPGNLDARFAYAVVLLSKGDLEAAQRELEEIQRRDPDHRRAAVSSLILQAQGHFGEEME